MHQWRVARSMTIRQTSRKSLAGFPVESLEKAKKEAKQINPQGQQRHVAGLILSIFRNMPQKAPMRVARIILSVV